MKNTFKIFGIIALVAVIIFSAAACRRERAPQVVEPPAVELNEVDRAIADFESLIDETTLLIQKAMEGDEEAAAALEALDEDRMDAVIERLESLEYQFTPEQEARVEELLYKFAYALYFGF